MVGRNSSNGGLIMETLEKWWRDNADYFAGIADLELGEVDVNGNPYNFDDDKKLYKQVPAWEDFQKICAEDIKSDFMYCLSTLDDSCQNKSVALCGMIEEFCEIADNHYEIWERNNI